MRNLRICFLSLVTLIKVFCASVSFTDGIDIASNGSNALSCMQIMLDSCDKLHKAVGVKTQEENSTYFLQK